MRIEPKGTVVIIPPTEPETADQILLRIFGMTAKEYAEKMLRQNMQTGGGRNC